jgi:hypothetical protein
MPWFAAALPVVPGKEDAARKRGEGFRQRLAEYERLNKEAGLKRHLEFLQETPMGATIVLLYEFEGDGSKLGRAFTDSEYDRWWVGHIKDVHGLDVSKPTPPPKTTLVHEWKAPGVS